MMNQAVNTQLDADWNENVDAEETRNAAYQFLYLEMTNGGAGVEERWRRNRRKIMAMRRGTILYE